MGQTPVRRSLHDLAEDIIPVRGADSVRGAGNPPDKRVTSARGANSMKIILLRNPKHVAPARGQPSRTQESPYPISLSLLRVQPPHTENPFCLSSRLTLRRVQSRTRSPLSGGHTKHRSLATSPHAENYSDIFEAPPGTAPAHGEPFLRVFPAHPAAGTTSYTESPSQRATPDAGRWQLPHTRGKAASVCAGRR